MSQRLSAKPQKALIYPVVFPLLTRLGGGIGTRGPGEKKLEMDRRLIRTRISHLKTELAGVIKHREVQRKQRQKNHTPVVCIVGYTNAGKSTLLNYFTRKRIEPVQSNGSIDCHEPLEQIGRASCRERVFRAV